MTSTTEGGEGSGVDHSGEVEEVVVWEEEVGSLGRCSNFSLLFMCFRYFLDVSSSKIACQKYSVVKDAS